MNEIIVSNNIIDAVLPEIEFLFRNDDYKFFRIFSNLIVMLKFLRIARQNVLFITYMIIYI